MLRDKNFLKEVIYWCIVLTCVIIYGLGLGFFVIGGFILLCGGSNLVPVWIVIVGAIISIVGTSYFIATDIYLKDDDS